MCWVFSYAYTWAIQKMNLARNASILLFVNGSAGITILLRSCSKSLEQLLKDVGALWAEKSMRVDPNIKKHMVVKMIPL